MKRLDDLKEMQRIDPDGVLKSIQAFPDQLTQTWRQAQQLVGLSSLTQVKKLVLAGMGGSALGGRVIKNLFEEKLKIPFEVVADYQLPAFVDNETLVITASYSGKTEETLSCLQKAHEAKAMIFAITTGGQVADQINHGLPGFIFQPKFNFLGFPKTAIGYSLGALLGFLVKIGLIHFNNEQFKKSLAEFKKVQKKFLAATPFNQNPAKRIAWFLEGKIGVLVASQYLKGAAWACRNQVNEIAHSFCLFFDLPEMDHHLVEAFAHPDEARQFLGYLFLSSKQYSPRVQIRYPITQKILKKLKCQIYEYQVQCQDKLAGVMEIVQLGGFTSFYLSVLNRQNPGPEPWILHLKKELTAYEKK